MAEDVRRAVCEMCHARCRVRVYSENNHLCTIEEDPTDPRVDSILPRTKSCLRLRAADEWLYHPDHLNYPLKRAGDRGEGRWQKISWDQALDEIAQRLGEIKEKYGAEALALTSGTLRTRGEYQARFMNLFGTPNEVGQSRICYAPVNSASVAMFGRNVRHRMTLTLEKEGSSQPLTKCVLIMGMTLSESYVRLWKSLNDGKKMGVKIIVIDPRRTPTTELADIWLQLRPGTDTALLLAMINVIVQEKLYDREFVENWCYGFDKLAERAKAYTPDMAAEITWVHQDKIIEAARMYATNRPAISTHGMGIEHLQNCMEAIFARLSLAAITGNIDNEGGHYMPEPPRCIAETEVELHELLPKEQINRQLGSHQFKLLCRPGYDIVSEYSKKVWGRVPYGARAHASAHGPTVYRTILTGEPYPVRAMLTNHSNPMITQGNTKLIYKALKSLDLYVVMDYWLTPSAELADYILPVASWLERPFLYTMGGQDNLILAGEQALPYSIPGEYDHKTDYDIWRELGLRFGQEKYWPWPDMEQHFDHRLEPLGLTFNEFMTQKDGFEFPPNTYKKYEQKGFATATGKVELYSTVLEKLGYDPLPKYEEPFETPFSRPDLAQEYPLILITGGRFRPMYHSEHRQVDSLRKRHPHPLVQIHPKTAESLGINEGDWAWIESPRGRIRMKCQYFDGVDPGVIHCEHGWWFPELPGEEPWLHGAWGSNINVLTDDEPEHCNPISGGWPLKTALCKVYKVKDYE